MALTRQALESELNQLLMVEQYSDYGPNGLQVEGKEKIDKILFAVSATKESIEQAVAWNADAMIVHHGLFWVFHGPRPITGPFAKRIIPLIKNDINLFGHHLPLDGHLELGNAASLAKKLGLGQLENFGDYKGAPTGVKGTFASVQRPSDIKDQLEKILNHSVIHAKAASDRIRSVGIITGGANGGWAQAASEGLDAYISGEISEHDWHESAEAGVHMFAGGHNATENFGVQELMSYLQKKYPQLECTFFASANPA